MASATPSPQLHRCRRKASVASQSTAQVSGGSPSSHGLATTCAAAYAVRDRGGRAAGATGDVAPTS